MDLGSLDSLSERSDLDKSKPKKKKKKGKGGKSPAHGLGKDRTPSKPRENTPKDNVFS